MSNYVGVIQTRGGFQIEVLPKIGRAIANGAEKARTLLIDMMRCLPGLRHLRVDTAHLATARMPLLEVFIGELLRAVELVAKSGIRSGYREEASHRFALRGKLDVPQHVRSNLCRRDRFFVNCDEWTVDRPENRVLHAALRAVLPLTRERVHQQLARELCFVFTDIPVSTSPEVDFSKIRIDRGMLRYEEALAWARLILMDESPLTGAGKNRASSLLFPMEALFEAFVAHHLSRTLLPPFSLITQASRLSLVRHRDANWFRLKPDLLVRHDASNHVVLDTKWKLVDAAQANASRKYGLSQDDFYQLHAYGTAYLEGAGDVVLIYPRTDQFDRSLDMFEFPHANGLRLWVVPFCLAKRRLVLTGDAKSALAMFDRRE